MKILVADTDPFTLRCALEALAPQGHDVLTASTEEQARELLQKAKPDLLVAEEGFPLRLPPLPTLKLTTAQQLTQTFAGGMGGPAQEPVDDFLVKPFRFQELSVRVQLLLERSRRHGDWVSIGSLSLSRERRQVRIDHRDVKLTPREFDLLAFLVARPGCPFTKESLVESVWEWGDCVNTNVVEVCISKLRIKLGLHSVIRTVRGVGYFIEDPRDLAFSNG